MQRKLPPKKRDRRRAANGTAAGSSVPDQVHMIFTETNATCDDGPGMAASCVYIKCLYLDMRKHDSAVKLLYWKHSRISHSRRLRVV